MRFNKSQQFLGALFQSELMRWAGTGSFQEQALNAWLLLLIVTTYTVWSLTEVWRISGRSIEETQNNSPK
jgi:hypothetical protein